ncbi:MAG: FRG domain-containing protein [Acidobacteriota bacterium]
MTSDAVGGPSDVVAKSWSHLQELLYTIPKTSHGRYRSNFVYRGVGDKSWGLETSLRRLGGDYVKVEKPLLRSFRKYAEPGRLPEKEIWVQIAIAQHHGLPTRLLDWTVSPQVGVHFATADEHHYDKDGAIWCVDVAEARSVLPARLRALLKYEKAFLFSVEMLETIPSLEAFDQMGEEEGDFVLFFEPPSLDSRIVNQGAIMSAMPGATLVLGDFLGGHPGLFKRIIIPARLKWEVRDKLDQNNVTERTLFPGLDGLSRWLRRYYGPGPQPASAPEESPPPSGQQSGEAAPSKGEGR